MDIQNFKKEGIRIQNNTAEEISEEYRNLLFEYQKKYFNQIISIVQQQIRGIPEYRMEEWIIDYLISDIKSEGNKEIRRMHAKLESEFETMTRNIQQNKSLSMSQEQYSESLNSIVRRSDHDWLFDISSEFIKQFKRKIENYYDVFHGISEYNFQRALDNMEIELKVILRKVNQQFIEEYQQILKKTINNNIQKINKNLENISIEEEKISEEYINSLNKILGYNDYELINENGKLYAKSNETGNVVELIYDSFNQVIKAKDGSVGIQIKDDKMISIDKTSNTTMIVEPLSLELSNLKRQFKINVKHGLIGYDFCYGDKKVTDLGEIAAIIDSIKSKTPKYYEELLSNKEFQELITKLEQYEKEHEEIYVDKTDNKVKVNPKTKEFVSLKLKLFGYELLEKEDGLYVIDLKTQEEHKIKAFRTGFGFEDKKAMELNFSTNLTVRTPNTIIPNNIEFHQENNSLFINENLTKFNIFIGNNSYKVEITEKGLSCTARDKNGEIIFMSNKEILSTIAEVFPYVVEYIQRKLRQQVTTQIMTEEQDLLDSEIYTEDINAQGIKRK